MKSRVLIIEDDPDWVNYLEEALSDDYELFSVDSGKSGLKSLKENPYNCIVLDLGLPDYPDSEKFEFLTILLKEHTIIPIIIFTSQDDTSLAVKAARLGAFDYLAKAHLDVDKLNTTVRNAVEQNKLKDKYQEKVDNELKSYQLIGESPEIQEVKRLVRKYAAQDNPVLITGESGTGKEIIARHLHYFSNRAIERLVTATVRGLDGSLATSELFGHKEGSFSGAIKDREGIFREADGGTVFLDDIDYLKNDVQVQLLRVIEDKKVKQIGSDKESLVDVKFLVSTNKDLKELISQGKFREDLYYRLSGFVIQLPPLRKRKGDIRILLDYFNVKYSSSEETLVFSQDALELIINYDWPGNVRQLENMVKKFIVLNETEIIESSDIAEHLGIPLPNIITRDTLKNATREFQKEYIENKLIANNNNITNTAEDLGIARPYLHRLIKMLGIISN